MRRGGVREGRSAAGGGRLCQSVGIPVIPSNQPIVFVKEQVEIFEIRESRIVSEPDTCSNDAIRLWEMGVEHKGRRGSGNGFHILQDKPRQFPFNGAAVFQENKTACLFLQRLLRFRAGLQGEQGRCNGNEQEKSGGRALGVFSGRFIVVVLSGSGGVPRHRRARAERAG